MSNYTEGDHMERILPTTNQPEKTADHAPTKTLTERIEENENLVRLLGYSAVPVLLAPLFFLWCVQVYLLILAPAFGYWPWE
jgi:hypothetical protein